MKAPLLWLSLLALLVAQSPAATFRVNNTAGTSANFSSIQAAVDAATNGDIILVEGSAASYAGFTLQNKRLSIIGPGYRLAANLGTPANKLGASIQGSSSYVRQNFGSPGSSTGTLIAGLEFNASLYLEACTGVTVNRCLFGGSSSGSLNVNGPGNVVSQSFFDGNYSGSLYLLSGSSGSRVENCIFSGYSSLSVGGNSSNPPIITLKNNLIWQYSSSGSAYLTYENNLFVGGSPSSSDGASTFRNNIFPSSLPTSLNGSGNLANVSLSSVMPSYQQSSLSFDSRYQLAPANNPALNAGTDGSHIGPFGGLNAYILSGIPPLPTIDELSVPQYASPGSTMTIRVRVRERP